MKQIFTQQKKQDVTDSIIKKSFKIYIDQFDPERIYLTEEEVRPFLQLTDSQIALIIEKYKNHDFSDYQNLNNVIQKAILRARQIRLPLERNQTAQLFQQSGTLSSDGYEDWRDPDLKRLFVAKENQLKERIAQHILQFIAGERKRFGDAQILSHPQETLQILEKQMRSHENSYLFAMENGQPMNAAEQQNIFALHILKSLANSLDAHTSVLNSSEAYDMRVRLEKHVDGVGVLFQSLPNGDFIISRILAEGPAAKSGLLKLGDRVMEVNGQSTKEMTLDRLMELMRGKNGTPITLTVQREGETNPIKVDLIRQEIQVNEDRVQYAYDNFGRGIIGKIKLDTFYQGDNGVTSENDVRDAIKKLERKGHLEALILDLRENSGGFLSQAVKVAGLFMTNGIVVISKYFNGEEKIYRDMDGKIAYDGPLIILTSKATASAAEIVAQALQDYGIAIIVGDEHTYGKGTIQSQTVTENQGSTYFKVTVGKYYTVSGKTPQMQGVKADIVVPSQFLHEHIGEEFLDYPLKEDMIASTYEDNLEDVPENLKSWYLHYYAPTIQHKTVHWKNMLSTLKNNSAYRMQRNSTYQAFLNSEQVPRSILRSVDDLQMNEATNIAKDMVTLQIQERNKFQETAARPAERANQHAMPTLSH